MKLGINTGFAVNRYPIPEQWMRIIGKELNLKYIQLTADLINPAWGNFIIDDLVKRINKCKLEYNINIESIMTGAFTRINHFSHPDENMRIYWKKWFKKLADITARLGANNLSSHLGIMCYEDLYNGNKRNFILKETINAWRELAEYCKKIGLSSLSWEPMSIKREYGETIEETERIQKLFEGSALPINLCLDVDHGDITSKNPADYDYKTWLKTFANITPFLHIKQSLTDKGGHYPFIEEYNKIGKINPKDIIAILKEKRSMDTILLLELSFREREPHDSLVLQHLKESVDYWKNALKEYD
ncbi:MAG: TIM barrel protein [Candidatus Woesearchaeota archaeon]